MTDTTTIERIERPAAGDFHSFYAGYIAKAEGDDPRALMAAQLSTTATLLGTLDEDAGGHRYAPGKWTVRQVVGHLSDTERIMAYRALALARGDATSLPGFDENAYVAAADFDGRTLASLALEWQAVRRSTIALFASLNCTAIEGRGTVNGGPMSVRALAYIIPGHEAHHLGVLRERYGIGRP